MSILRFVLVILALVAAFGFGRAAALFGHSTRDWMCQEALIVQLENQDRINGLAEQLHWLEIKINREKRRSAEELTDMMTLLDRYGETLKEQ